MERRGRGIEGKEMRERERFQSEHGRVEGGVLGSSREKKGE
jgi:hypothetical protein